MKRLLCPSLAIFLFSVCVSTNPVLNPAGEGLSLLNDDDLNYRLPGLVRPFKYVLTIEPNLDEWTFEGHVIIHIHTQVANVQEIVILSNDLILNQISIYKPPVDQTGYEELYSGDYSYDNVTHKVTIPTKIPLEVATTYYLEINYSGFMKDDMSGFHRSTYIENGQEIRLGTTQFQTTSARRAIPCFDEPGYKAVFELMIVRQKKYHTMSNTPILTTLEVQGQDDLLMDVYEPTPFMSVYLLAFIVSELTPRSDPFDPRFVVWARPEMYENTQYAYDVGTKLLDHYNAYTDYNYYNHMSKLDMAAVPDNRAGGMENYGMIIYRESYLLYNADKTSAYAKQDIATVIAHEQAHLWFGDLVRVMSGQAKSHFSN